MLRMLNPEIFSKIRTRIFIVGHFSKVMEQEVKFDTEELVKSFCKENQKYIYEKGYDSLLLKSVIKKYNGKPSSFNFPYKIKISPCVVGLIVGEGYIDERRFMFANSNETVIKRILEFLLQFGISPSFVLEVATKNMGNEFIDKSKEEWEKVVNKKILKIRIRKEFNNTTKKGTLHVNYYNSCFSKILNLIIEDVKNKVEFNKNLSIDYLKGILAAEGNINVKSTTTNCLYLVRISAKEKKEREHYKRCLEKIGIKIYCKDMPSLGKHDKRTKHWKTKKGRGGAVLINRWLNFYKIFSMDLLDIHEDKKQKFIKHFLCNKTTKMVLEFQGLPKKWFTIKEFKDVFKLKAKPNDRIKKMIFLGFIEKRKPNPKIERSKCFYRLTHSYFKFVNKLRLNGFHATPLV